MHFIMAACVSEIHPKMDKIRVYLNVVTTVVCLIGCMYHAFTMTRQYLKYETFQVYAPYIPRTVTVPNLALCFTRGLQAAVNRTFLDHKLDETALETFSSHDSPMEASQIIKTCRFRNFTTGTVQNGQCDQVFYITRRAAGFYECFMLFPKEESNYNLLKMVTAPTARSFLYQVSLASNRSRVGRILPMINFKKWPYEEFLYSLDLDIWGEGKKFFYLSHRVFIFKKLPRPYDTQCVMHRPSHCFVSGKQIGEGICDKPLCDHNITISISKMSDAVKAGLHFEVDSFTSPIHLIKYAARIRPEEFFIQVCSILGLWLGLSFIFITEKFIEVFQYFFGSKSKDSNSLAMKCLLIQVKLVGTAAKARVHLKLLNAFVTSQLAPPAEPGHQFTFLRLLCKFIVASLCCFELINITQDYSKYQTLMEIDVRMNAKIPYPDVSFCFYMGEFLSHFEQIFPYFQNFDSEMGSLAHQFNYTLSEYFEKIPPVDSVIKSCRVRTSMSSPLEMYTNCSKHFEVNKFWQSQFLCYKFKPKFDHLIEADVVRRNIDQPGVLYSLAINDKVASIDFKLYQLIVSYGYPRMSRFISNRNLRTSAKLLKVLSFFSYITEDLPAPYDTKCIDFGSFSGCNNKCMNLSLINRIPYSELYEEPIDKYFVSYSDLKNSTVAEIVSDQEKKCERICHRDCKDNFTKTMYSYEYSSNELFEIALLIPAQTSYALQAVPHYTFSLFIYQMACCLSFWAGFCLIKFSNFWSSVTPTPEAQPQMIHLNALVDRLEKIFFVKVGRMERLYSWMKLKVKLKSRFLNNIFFIIGTFCFLYHCYDSASFYFRYFTRLDTRLRFESNFTDLYATMCITIDQLDLQGNYSLVNIFDKSPDTSNILLECGHRGINLEQLAHLTPLLKQRVMPWINLTEVCNKYFDTVKVITFGMVCYNFVPKPGAQDAEYNPKYHILAPKLFEYFSISNDLAMYNLTIKASQGISSSSLFFATQIPGVGKSKAYWGWVSYIRFYVDPLPYPYHMGRYIGIKNQRCVRRCVEAYRSERGKFSSYGRKFSPLNLTHEMNEEFMSKASEEVRKNCEAKCDVNRFYGRRQISFSDTYIYGPYLYNSAPRGSLSLFFKTSDYLVTYTKFIPWLRLLDLFLAIGTSFAIWFGLSCLDLTDLMFKITHHHSHNDSTDLLYQRLERIEYLVQKTRELNSSIKSHGGKIAPVRRKSC